MPFFVKTVIIKKEYLINNDLKRKVINEHNDWIKKLKKEGINIKSGFLIDELKKTYTKVIETHSMAQAVRVSQKTGFFHLGKLIEVGKTEKIFKNPDNKMTQDYITGRFG